MSAQITVEQSSPILGQPTHLTFLLHSPSEIVKLVRENRSAGQATVIFAHRVATAKFIAGVLRDAGLSGLLLTGDTTRVEATGILDRASGPNPISIVTTDAHCTGWAVPSEAPVLHAELPPYTDGFVATMLQREARVRPPSPA